jgi:hypothetical protein
MPVRSTSRASTAQKWSPKDPSEYQLWPTGWQAVRVIITIDEAAGHSANE